jgi:glycosyltransferase involved in cell wall biosynthesis
MKILMLLDSEFPPDVRVESEANSLIQQGHSVTILSYNYGTKPERENIRGIQVVRFPINKQFAKKALGLIHRLPFYRNIWKKQVCNLLKSGSFDAVHIHDLPLCVIAGFIRKNFNVKVVADMHENYPYLVSEQPFMNTLFAKVFLSKKIWFRKEKEWLLQTSEIVCVAEEMKDRLDKVLGNKININVVPNTLNFDTFLTSQKPVSGLKEKFESYFKVVYIGGFDPVRGLEYLLEAAVKLKTSINNLKIILVGDGAIAGNLKELSIRLGIENSVTFEGWQPGSNVQAYIELADICIIPHVRSEQTDNSSPNKLFQYMYFRKPVISSNCVSLQRLIEKEQCGLIFEDKNSTDLADKILVLYNNNELKEQLGNNGYESVNTKYNWATTVKALFNVYPS